MSGASSRDVGCGAVCSNCTDHELYKVVVEENSHFHKVLIVAEFHGLLVLMSGVGVFVVTVRIMN